MVRKIEDYLVVGKDYFVPCISIPDKFASGYLLLEKGWLPVFSSSHVDIKTAFAVDDEDRLNPIEGAAHYHVDVRFIQSDLPMGMSIGISAQIISNLMELDDEFALAINITSIIF